MPYTDFILKTALQAIFETALHTFFKTRYGDCFMVTNVVLFSTEI